MVANRIDLSQPPVAIQGLYRQASRAKNGANHLTICVRNWNPNLWIHLVISTLSGGCMGTRIFSVFCATQFSKSINWWLNSSREGPISEVFGTFWVPR